MGGRVRVRVWGQSGLVFKHKECHRTYHGMDRKLYHKAILSGTSPHSDPAGAEWFVRCTDPSSLAVALAVVVALALAVVVALALAVAVALALAVVVALALALAVVVAAPNGL